MDYVKDKPGSVAKDIHAETFIPYPGPPVTPQARSEKKMPPTPPTIMTKLNLGESRFWNATPNDLNNLLKMIKDFLCLIC